MMQFVYTVPPSIRPFVQSREKQNSLCDDAKQVTAKYFGDPSKAKRNTNGYIKEYSFGNELAIGYLHLFGDPDKSGKYREGDSGTFHPHVNVHVFKKSDNLYLPPETLDKMRHDWKKKLKKYGKIEGEVDIHFLYVKQSAKEKKKYHKIKYMVKPYLKENIDKVIENDDLELLKFLTVDLKGFQFIRFWGGLSNVKKGYRDEVGIYPDNIDEIESRINETLIFKGVTEWNLKSYLEADQTRVKNGLKPRLKRIAENFYKETVGYVSNG